MARKKYRFHPACTVFPQLSDDELKDLADDIAANGLRNPIVVWRGKILDGRNRYLACEIAEVEPRFTEFEGDDPIGWVISQNLQRRHLTASQKALVALDVLPLLEKEAKQRQRRANEYRGNGHSAQKCAERNGKGKAAEAAARIVGASPRYIEMVKSVKQKAPELVDQIRTGELSVSEAEKLASLPKRERQRALRLGSNGATSKNGSSTYVFNGGGPKNPRQNTIATPPGICRFLHDLISPFYKIKTILDPSAGDGALTKPWKGVRVISYEILKGNDFFECPDKIAADLVLCNPPFNNMNGETRFLPHVFLERIFEVVSARTPVVLFTPMAMRLDQTSKSSRWLWLRDHAPPITTIITLPHDAFGTVKVHSEILIFNAPKLKPHYFLPNKYLRR
jgi:ParB-like chromosome segregation protein Spo0J